jgi:hypothetical protein
MTAQLTPTSPLALKAELQPQLQNARVVRGTGAQEAGRVYKVGWLVIGRPDLVFLPMEKWTNPFGVAFRDTLRNNGFVHGKNLFVEVRHATTPGWRRQSNRSSPPMST